jgi:hypothetical protein
MFYLVLPGPTLTVDPSEPALPFQDDARFPAAPRLRIWRLGVRIAAGTGSSSTGWDNDCNYEPANVHWANPSGAKQSRRRWATEQ